MGYFGPCGGAGSAGKPDPTSGEISSYNRVESSCFWWIFRQFRWTWSFDSAITTLPGGFPQLRFRAAVSTLADGTPDWQPVSAWTQSTDGRYAFDIAIPDDGWWAAGIEGLPVGVEPLHKSFLINATGARLPDAKQIPWTAITRLELNGGYANGIAQVAYPGARPVPPRRPLKHREILPYSTALPMTALWQRRIGDDYRYAMKRRFVAMPPYGDVGIEAVEKYEYYEATTQGSAKVGLQAPLTYSADGPRGVGGLGYLAEVWLRSDLGAMYFAQTDGRIGVRTRKTFLAPAGTDMSQSPAKGVESELITFFGWCAKRDRLTVHRGVKSGLYGYGVSSNNYRPQDQQQYEDAYEFVGDRSKIPGLPNESWGFAVAKLDLFDNTIDPRHGLEFWSAWTLAHVIVYINAWPMHQALRRRATFPPVGYVDPGFTGQSDAVVFQGTYGIASEFVNEPWKVIVDPVRRRIVWTNYAGGSLCSCNMDGSDVVALHRDPQNPSDIQLGIPSRLSHSSISMTALRASYLRDGPANAASMCRPQWLAINSRGNYVWVERYTYAVRELDLATMTVRTIWRMPGAALAGYQSFADRIIGEGSSYANDVNLSIDIKGTCGPVDRMAVHCWHASSWFVNADGTGLTSAPFFASGAMLRNGACETADKSNYGWAGDIWAGCIVTSGNDSGHQENEITKRLPSDLAPDTQTAIRGWLLYQASPMYLTHGPAGQGELGLKTIEQMGELDDAALKDYSLAHGMLDSAILWNPSLSKSVLCTMADWIVAVRYATCDFDYGAPAVPDPVPPAAPIADVVIVP